MTKTPLLGLLLLTALASVSARGADPSPTTSPAVSSAAPATAPAPKSWSFYETGLIPVQSGGRIKPFDSFAREVIFYITGSKKFRGYDSVDLLFSWLTRPQIWTGEPIIQIGRDDVRRQLGLDEKRRMYSPAELYQNFVLAQYAERLNQAPGSPAGQVAPVGARQDDREKELKQVFDRLGLFRAVIAGQAWLVVPKGGGAPWETLLGDPAHPSVPGAAGAGQKEGDQIRASFLEMVKAYMADDVERFGRASTLARSAVEGSIPGWNARQAGVIQAEAIYNKFRPFFYAWILYLVAALAWLLSRGGKAKKRLALARGITVLALLCHVGGIALRCYIAGRPPVTNMYESVIWVMFGTILFASILYVWSRQTVAMIVACTVATLGLILADAVPSILDSGIHPLVPVLRSNYWLTIHVLTITLGYSAFALTLGLANVSLYHFIRSGLARSVSPDARQRIQSLNLLAYRATQFGVVLLAAGTILGGIWADYSWGRFWGWDPKEVWALTALLCYLVILHARFTNWVGQFGFAALSVVMFLSVVMAWYGVNFVLGVGLHSYGFATGGRGYVAAFVLLQLAYVGFAWIMKRRLQGAAGPRTPVAAPTSG